MVAAASAFLAVESSGPAVSTAPAWMAVMAFPCWIAAQVCPDYRSGSRLWPDAARYPQSAAGFSPRRCRCAQDDRSRILAALIWSIIGGLDILTTGTGEKRVAV